MRALNAALSLYWAIQEESLRATIQVLARLNLNVQEALAIREARDKQFDESLPAPQAVEAQKGQPLEGTRRVTVRDRTAIIKVIGPIVRRAGFFSEISGATSIETLAQDFNFALTSNSVDSIVFYFDSPGGEVNGINEFAQMIYESRGKKPMTAYAAGLCASGAYWLATACDEIVVDATAVLGSIGIVATYLDTTGADAQMGIKEIEIVSSQSPRKRLDPDSQEGRRAIQETVDALASVFVTTVARNRGVKEAKVLADFGQGGVMVGQAAVDAGLANRLGSFEQGLAELTGTPSLPMPEAKKKASSDFSGLVDLTRLSNPKR